MRLTTHARDILVREPEELVYVLMFLSLLPHSPPTFQTKRALALKIMTLMAFHIKIHIG
jgi:hypothetical protein